MNIPLNRGWLCGLGLLAALLLVVNARAGEIDAYLPEDTEVILSLNVKQFLSSGLAKKLGIDKAKDSLKEIDIVGDVLKDLGFDPFTDLDRVIAAGPGSSDPDKGIFILRGKFDVAKFKEQGDKAIKDHGDIVKSSKVGDKVVYEVNVPGQDGTLFVSLVDNSTVLVSPGKPYISDALKKVGSKDKLTLKSKQFQTILEKQNDKQIFTVVALGSALPQNWRFEGHAGQAIFGKNGRSGRRHLGG